MTKKLLLVLIAATGILAVGCSGGKDEAPNVPSDPAAAGQAAPAGGSAPSMATPQKPAVGPDGGPP